VERQAGCGIEKTKINKKAPFFIYCKRLKSMLLLGYTKKCSILLIMEHFFICYLNFLKAKAKLTNVEAILKTPCIKI